MEKTFSLNTLFESAFQNLKRSEKKLTLKNLQAQFCNFLTNGEIFMDQPKAKKALFYQSN